MLCCKLAPEHDGMRNKNSRMFDIPQSAFMWLLCQHTYAYLWLDAATDPPTLDRPVRCCWDMPPTAQTQQLLRLLILQPA